MVVCSRCRCILPQKLPNIPQSPVPELIRTYHAPSSSQISSIQQCISDTQPTLCDLNNEISKLQDALDDLRRRHAELTRYTQEHQAILSPMRRLPFEILGEIFNLCLDDRWQNRIFNVREAPLLLSQVCIGWRDGVF